MNVVPGLRSCERFPALYARSAVQDTADADQFRRLQQQTEEANGRNTKAGAGGEVAQEPERAQRRLPLLLGKKCDKPPLITILILTN